MQPFRRRSHRRILASIACLAFVLQGLTPSIAHAAASLARAQLFLGELCTADPHGARLRLADAIAAEAPPADRSLPQVAHCPFCALPTGGDAPPSNAVTRDFSLTPARHVLPSVSPDEPAPLPAQWRAQAPRAPPHA